MCLDIGVCYFALSSSKNENGIVIYNMEIDAWLTEYEYLNPIETVSWLLFLPS